METYNVHPIEKEDIAVLVFASNSTQQTQELQQTLEKAASLGNLYHNKVKIFFQAIQGNFVVETTIWATSSAYICLKGGITLPVQAITSLQLI